MIDEKQTPHGWRADRFMVIVAHPDDADFGPAAAAAAWIEAGSEGWLVCCTSGDAGSDDPDANPMELARAREVEQREAARIVGYKGVTFLHQPDGALENSLALREMLVREIRTFRPDAVFAGDPEVVIHAGGGINHTDHRAAAMAAVDAVYPAARNPMAFSWLHRQGLPMHKVRRMYLMWSNQPNVWIDVSATAERKIEALRAHASQLRDPEAVFARVRSRLAEQGERIGTAAGEPYRLVVLDPEPEPIDAETPDVEEALTSTPASSAKKS